LSHLARTFARISAVSSRGPGITERRSVWQHGLVLYLEDARTIWQTQVPKRGQANTVAGELLRSVEKLRDEAQRNGNVNWGDGHVRMLAYLRRHLLEVGLLPIEEQATIVSDLDRVADFEHPETGDVVYDRLSDAVVLWTRAHPEGPPHDHDPELRI
jgi:prepilin-type processing-associated H-X9-DG protein